MMDRENRQRGGRDFSRERTPEPLFYFDGPGDDEARVSDYWGVIARHKWGIIGLALVAALIGAITALSARPVYKAEAKLLIEPEAPKVVSVETLQAASNIWFFYETQYEIIRSRSVAEPVIDKLKLADDPVFLGQSDKDLSGPFSYIRALLGFNLRSLIPREWFSGGGGGEAGPDGQEARDALVVYFLGGLAVDGEENSQIVNVSYETGDPRLSAKIANAVVEAYMERNLESRLRVARQASSWLTARLGEIEKKLAQSEEALLAFQSREGVVDSESQQDIVKGRISKITAELVKAQIARAEAESRYNQLVKADQEGMEYDSLQPVLQSLLIQKLKEEEARLARRAAELSERYGEKHPKMIAARSDLAEARRRLGEEVARVADGIRKEYEVALENERKLMALGERHEEGIRALRGKEFELARLEREVETNRRLYEMFLTRFKETDIAEEGKVTNVHVIDEAKPPLNPFKPRKTRMVAVFTVAGLILGVALAFLKESLDSTFRNHEDIERRLAMPSLGIVPRLGKKDIRRFLAERDTVARSRSPFTESINNIRTSLLFSNVDNPPKVTLITSAAPGEGKTSLSLALALSLSQLGPALLLEADLRKPSLAGALGVRGRPGIAGVVAGRAALSEAVSRDRGGRLYYITAGAPPPNPLEFVSSRRFAAALAELGKRFEYVVIDTPPVLLFSDALVIGRLADAAIMAVRADLTTGKTAQEALRRIQGANISLLGAVLSHVDTSGLDGSSGYQYYGKYYGYRERNGSLL